MGILERLWPRRCLERRLIVALAALISAATILTCADSLADTPAGPVEANATLEDASALNESLTLQDYLRMAALNNP